MPEKWLIDYWRKAAEATLPFLKNRRVAIQQVFNTNIIYRRHGEKGLPHTRGWITIKNEEEILEWAYLHTYSFHPHLLGEEDTWFVIDVDGRNPDQFELTKIAAYELSQILERHRTKYLIKFSGGNGFHFMWSLGNERPNWLSFRKTIRIYAKELEMVLQENHAQKFHSLIPRNHPLVVTSSSDQEHRQSILIDEQIIHKNAVVRSPYSIHPKTKLVSLPLISNEILGFKANLASLDKIKPKPVKLPIN